METKTEELKQARAVVEAVESQSNEYPKPPTAAQLLRESFIFYGVAIGVGLGIATGLWWGVSSELTRGNLGSIVNSVYFSLFTSIPAGALAGAALGAGLGLLAHRAYVLTRTTASKK